MILTVDVYNLLIDALRADKRGNSCDIDEFNRLIRLINQDIYNDALRDFEENTETSDITAKLKEHNCSIDLTALTSAALSYGTIPTNFYRIIGKPRVLNGTATRRVDIVPEYEDSMRQEDYLTQASVTYPTCRIGGIDGTGALLIKVRPQTITKVWVDYLKTVSVPFLDYYTNDTTFVKTFLLETGTAQSVPDGSTYRDGTPGGAAVTVTSITKDFSWDEGELSLILAKLVQKIGAELPDAGLVQTGMADELKTQD